MFQGLLVLSVMSKHDSGVGLSRIIECCKEAGHDYSRYKMRQILKELVSVGVLHRVRNHYVMTLLGANLSVADDAAASGHFLAFSENGDYMPCYQKELSI